VNKGIISRRWENITEREWVRKEIIIGFHEIVVLTWRVIRDRIVIIATKHVKIVQDIRGQSHLMSVKKVNTDRGRRHQSGFVGGRQS
jgi:hypothetical protein